MDGIPAPGDHRRHAIAGMEPLPWQFHGAATPETGADEAARVRAARPAAGPGLLDLSENNSTLGVPPVVMAAMRNATATTVTAFVAAASARDGVAGDCILPGNGTLELIHAAARAIVRPDDRVAVFGPTFGEFGAAAGTAGAEVIEIRAGEEAGFRWDMAVACRTLREKRPSAIFLCNPNNPTGACLSRGEVGEVLSAAGDGVLLLDEAYAGLAFDRWPVPGEWLDSGLLLVLRSVSKACAMEFLGAGYAVGAPPLLARLRAAMGSSEMNPVTAAGAAAYLSNPSLERDTGKALRESLAELAGGLSSAGFKVLPGAANFMMVRTGEARRFRWELMRLGILAKELDGYGLPDWIRIAAPPPGMAAKVASVFVAAMEALA